MTVTDAPRTTRRPKAVWVPREHGAWSWLATPVVAGAIVVGPRSYQLLLLAVALSGYLFFNAASWWAKMPPRRRGAAVRPMVVYGGVAGVFCLALLLAAGVGVVGWLPVLAVPLAVAYLLTLAGSGRSLGSGLATACAASALTLVAVQPDLLAFLRGPQARWLWLGAIVFGHTSGTLFAVKSMIRERDSNAYLVASVGWHAAWVAAVAVGAGFGLPWAWTGFFLATAVRAVVLPLVVRRRPLRPMTIGLVELAFTVALLLLVGVVGV